MSLEGQLPIADAPLWRELVERLPAVVYMADFDERGTLRWISPRVEDLLGVAADDFLEDDDLWYRCIHPDDVDRVRAEETRVHREVEPFDCEYRMRHADGSEVIVWERDAIVRDDNGRPVCTQGVVVDVTSLRAAERRADAEAHRANGYLDLVGTIVMQLDHEGRITVVNRAMLDLLGYREDEMVGAISMELLQPPHRRAEVAQIFTDAMSSEPEDGEQIEVAIYDRNGRPHDVLWSATRLQDDQGRQVGMLCAGIDLTDRRQAEERAAYLVRHDPLTGLPNRAGLTEHIDLALARCRRDGTSACLLVLDIDDFKLVNESLGHAAGDGLLAQVALRLSARRRAQDVLARVGADEFAVLLTGLPRADADPRAEAAARRYAAALESPFDIADTVFDLRASVGAAIFPEDADDGGALHRRASAALHSAKASGRGMVRRYRAERDEPRRPLSLTARLRSALQRGELVLHWQPIVDPADGRLHAVEGLVRWEAPGGLLGPSEFVPFAEEAGLIEQLDAYVLARACAEVAGWGGPAATLPFSVNLSPRALAAPGFASRVAETLHAHRVDPGRLVLEVTESTAMVEAERSAPVLHEISALGVQLAIDDFGAGYSSLARLLELPVDILKVDRGFLQKATSNTAAAAMIGAIVGLAQSLDVLAVVEGVETEEQLELIRKLGTPLAQGFLLGVPVAGRELLPRLSGVLAA